MKAPEYEINSIDDICDTLTTENYVRFMTDVISSFTFYLESANAVKKLHPEFAHLKNSEIAKFSFVWIDDGKNDVKSITIKGPEGQETKINFEK